MSHPLNHADSTSITTTDPDYVKTKAQTMIADAVYLAHVHEGGSEGHTFDNPILAHIVSITIDGGGDITETTDVFWLGGGGMMPVHCIVNGARQTDVDEIIAALQGAR